MAEAEKESESSQPIAEISHEPSKFEGFLNQNFKWLVVGMIVLAIAVAGWVVNRHIGDEERQAAGAALVAADEVEDFQEITKTYPGTPSATTALVRMSDFQWEQGLQEDSLESLRKAIGGASDHPSVPSARARLGARLLQQGDLNGAAEQFEELVDAPGARYIAPYAETMLAEIQLQRGDEAAAAKRLEQATKSYRGAAFGRLLNEHRQLVSFELPEEVDPPAVNEDMPDESIDLPGNEDFVPGIGAELNNPLLENFENKLDSPLEGSENENDTLPDSAESSPSSSDAEDAESPASDPDAKSGE